MYFYSLIGLMTPRNISNLGGPLFLRTGVHNYFADHGKISQNVVKILRTLSSFFTSRVP